MNVYLKPQNLIFLWLSLTPPKICHPLKSAARGKRPIAPPVPASDLYNTTSCSIEIAGSGPAVGLLLWDSL
jgi:hypothetical protein